MFQSRRKKYREKTDQELILIYRESSHNECLGILYERYGHLVMGACLKYLKNIHNAEDICMQIFETLSDKLIKHDIVNFKSWLFTVTRNECLMYFRKTKKEDISIEHFDGADINEEYNLNYDLDLEHLKNFIETLKEEQRKCLELFYFSNQSYEQISTSLEISIKQVKSAIQNGKRNLKIKMMEYSSVNTNLEL
jgi:RNA polymerase sigma-70 factor (ECF subfamily)